MQKTFNIIIYYRRWINRLVSIMSFKNSNYITI